MLRKRKTPFIRDIYFAYLIKGAKRTKTDEFPIIEKRMISNDPPKEIIQRNRRQDVKEPKKTTICFYCDDYAFNPILNNPKVYIEKLKSYDMVIGIDASPYENMPLVVQKSQIYLNLALTYYFGSQGLKIIPNLRIGDDRTLSSLEAYPKHTLIAFGTNGFVKSIENRIIFADQVMKIIDFLEPTGVVVYGPDTDEIFNYVRLKGIPIYQYDSYTMKQNEKDRAKKILGEKIYER